jgi:hypothetical protein
MFVRAGLERNMGMRKLDEKGEDGHQSFTSGSTRHIVPVPFAGASVARQ